MNKHLLVIVGLFITFYAWSQDQWTQEKRNQYLLNRQNQSTWDMEMLEEDKQLNQIPTSFMGCMKIGAFPVSDYESIESHSFKGVGFSTSTYDPILLEDKKVVYTAFGINGDQGAVFFNIVTVTDTIDSKNYSTARTTVLSRNHPDYLGQGYIKTKSTQVDYMAFTTAEGNAYAIVNARLFDLTYGSTVLITPQLDGTFRSMQIKGENQTLDSIEEYVKDKLVQQKEVLLFLTEEGVI